MNLKRIGSTEESPLVKVAALIIIFAGVIYAKSIIAAVPAVLFALVQLGLSGKCWTLGMFLSVPFTMTIKIILEQNDKTKWLAMLLGTPAEAKTYLEHKELIVKL
jgi:hypothetical protein